MIAKYFRPGILGWCVGPCLLLVLAGCATSGSRHSAAALHFNPSELPPPNPAGPTVHFGPSADSNSSIPIADFMYCIPVVSPEPMSVSANSGNTQRVRIVPATRRVSDDSFSIECELEISGEGSLINKIDHTPNIRRNSQKLAGGGVIERVLNAITIDGPGAATIEVEGAISNGVASVNEVRMRFNTRNRRSPVNIEVANLNVTNDVVIISNEHLARVNSLSFHRGPPLMGVTIGSIRRKDGTEGLWSRLAGLAANFVLKPVKVDPSGHEAMLNLGRQLAGQAASYTYPQARNLQPPTFAQPSK